MKFGITEKGDPASNYSWKSNVDKVDGFILITKNITDRIFLKHAMGYKDKCIVHASITTLGGSFIEPNVAPWEESIDILNKFSEIFPEKQLVLRIDPIIPSDKVLKKVEQLIKLSLIRRIRFSFIDNYRHLQSRGLILPWKTFRPPIELIDNTIEIFKTFENSGKYSIECCGESSPIIPPYWKLGCVSTDDFSILNLKGCYEGTINIPKQRPSCNCHSAKIELIDLKINPVRCTNGCLYCYWKD